MPSAPKTSLLSMNGRNTAVVAVSAAILGTLYLIYTPQALDFRNHKHSPEDAAHLTFRLSQISRSPPSLLVTIRNNSPSITFTILRWGTPFDPQSINEGVYRITDLETGAVVDYPRLLFSRVQPPPREEFLEIPPGTEHAIEQVFDRPWLQADVHKKYQVCLKGKIKCLWAKPLAQITDEEIAACNNGPLDGLEMECEDVIMDVSGRPEDGSQ